MRIAYSWLKTFIDITESPEEISDVLTQTGLEVEGLERTEKIKGGLHGLVVGEVLACGAHPNADKLKLTQVDIGLDEPVQIVCGGPNVAAGQKVIVAPVNTQIHPTNADPFTIKKAKIRGEQSMGMICAEDEIGLGSGHDGVIVLETNTPNGTPAANLFDTGEDFVYEIGLTPNRGDAASHLGCARDLRAYYDRPITLPEIKAFEIREDRPIQVEVEDLSGCPRYSGVTIRGIRVAPSPDWLQGRLRSIGLEPINNIVDITNYVLHGLGQPLHAFDADVVGTRVLVKNLPEGSKFITLDEKERKLSGTDLMICNEQGGMCIGGVFGGIQSGVKETTTSLFLESAYFSADRIRATALRHGLNTDASFRYERGTDPEMTLTALQYATQLILEIAGGHVASEFVDIYPKHVPPVEIKTRFDSFHRLIGKALPEEEIISILQHLDIETRDQDGEGFTAVVPPYRSEVTRTADLVEEVLRIHGINNIDIDESFSTDYLAEFEENEPYKLQEQVSYFLAGKGFHEIITNSITNKAHADKLQLGSEEYAELLNKSSEDLGILKTTPLFTGLESIRHNLNRRQADLKFFEFAKSYLKKTDQYIEVNKLVIYATGNMSQESWSESRPKIEIHHLTAWIEGVLRSLGFDAVQINPTEDALYDYGVTIKANGKKMGTCGKLRQSILRYFTIQSDVFYGELNWDAICAKASREVRYEPISKFPEVRRDLSLVIPKSISYKEIQEIAFNSEKKLLNRMNVFSVYEGAQIEEDKKAYAIAFYLQDKERTLKDKQIDKVMNTLVSRFEQNLGAIIRK